MRFCPFCAQENPDDARECGHCGKRLPPPRTAPPRPAHAAPPVAERPKREIPARPAPRSMPLKGQEPLPDRPLDSVPHPIESHADTAPAALPSIPAARPLKPLSQLDTQAPTISGDQRVPPLTPPPPPKPGNKTVLGLGAIDPPTAPSKLPPPNARPSTEPGLPPVQPFPHEQDSARRSTKPLSVQAAASAAKEQQKSTQPRGVNALGPTLAVPAKPAPKSLPRSHFDDEQSTTVDPRAPQNPLPPAVETHPVLKAPPAPVELGGDTDENAPNQPMEGTHTPVLPTMALPPMPPPPRSGKIVDSVLYLLPLAKAIWARKKAQDNIRALLHGDQKLLDQVLRDLGRAAREAKLDVPAVAEEMRRVRAEEDRRSKAEQTLIELEQNREKELERWGAEEAERTQDAEERESQIRGAEEELRKKGDERRIHDAERVKIDAQIRALEKKAAQEDARAAKADITPPEKGGGPNTAANARSAADAARKEATGLIPSRDIARAKVEALDAPIGALTKQVVDGRATLGLKRKELTESQAAHKRQLAQFDADKRRAEAERDGAEREMSQRFTAAGTLLNLNRVQDSRFQSLYDRIDELKAGVNAREAAIVRLEGERRGYDRPSVQKGLLAIGIAAGAVILLLIILIIVLGRH